MSKTRTKQILELLVKGNKTFAEIQKELQIDEIELRSVIGYLRQRNYIESVPMTYGLSFDGFQRLKHKPKTSPEKLAQKRARSERVRMAESLRARGVITNVFNLGGFTQ